MLADGNGASKYMLVLDKLLADPDAALDPPPSISLRDYTIAAHRIQASAKAHADINWWRARVAVLPPPPALPMLQQTQASRTKMRQRAFNIPARQWSVIVERGKRLGVTPSFLCYSMMAEVYRMFSGSSHFILSQIVMVSTSRASILVVPSAPTLPDPHWLHHLYTFQADHNSLYPRNLPYSSSLA